MENREHCKYIAEQIEKVCSGEMCRCPECGEIMIPNFEITDGGEYCYSCTECGHASDDQSDFEEYTLWDYFENDIYNIEYRFNANRELTSVQIMVACGGPNIYIDTKTQAVELYWWTDRAEYPLAYGNAAMIDEIFAELWGC